MKRSSGMFIFFIAHCQQRHQALYTLESASEHGNSAIAMKRFMNRKKAKGKRAAYAVITQKLTLSPYAFA